MEITFGMVAFVYLVVVSIGLAWINRTQRTDFEFPGGYGVPSALFVVGAGIFLLSDFGLETVFRTIASAVFVGFVFYAMETQLGIDPDGGAG